MNNIILLLCLILIKLAKCDDQSHQFDMDNSNQMNMSGDMTQFSKQMFRSSQYLYSLNVTLFKNINLYNSYIIVLDRKSKYWAKLISKEETDENSILNPNAAIDLDRKNNELMDLMEIIELDELISKFKPGMNDGGINVNKTKTPSLISSNQHNSKSRNSILTAVLNNFDNSYKNKKKFQKTNFFHSVWG